MNGGLDFRRGADRPPPPDWSGSEDGRRAAGGSLKPTGEPASLFTPALSNTAALKPCHLRIAWV